jgi:hypothetical protein
VKTIEFEEQTMIIASDQPQRMIARRDGDGYVRFDAFVRRIPAHRFADDGDGRVAWCWKLSWRERLVVLATGRLWHQVLTFAAPFQPQLLTVEKPQMTSAGEMEL